MNCRSIVSDRELSSDNNIITDIANIATIVSDRELSSDNNFLNAQSGDWVIVSDRELSSDNNERFKDYLTVALYQIGN